MIGIHFSLWFVSYRIYARKTAQGARHVRLPQNFNGAVGDFQHHGSGSSRIQQ